MNNHSWQEILCVGCEGGGITLLGSKLNNNWKFKMATDETSLKAFINEKDLPRELSSESDIVSTWEGALKLLNQYPHWPTLYPITAHPEFSDKIERELIKLGNHPNLKGDIDWTKWKMVLYAAPKPKK